MLINAFHRIALHKKKLYMPGVWAPSCYTIGCRPGHDKRSREASTRALHPWQRETLTLPKYQHSGNFKMVSNREQCMFKYGQPLFASVWPLGDILLVGGGGGKGTRSGIENRVVAGEANFLLRPFVCALLLMRRLPQRHPHSCLFVCNAHRRPEQVIFC